MNQYQLTIRGKLLGDCTGSELREAAASELETVRAHQFNTKLCSWLKDKVKDKQTVKDAVDEQELQKGFKEIHSQVYGIC